MTDSSTGLRPWMNTDLDFHERARLLVSEMTLDEKAWQMVNHAPGIERLGVPPYNWWNECLHGVGRAGIATVFPQAIGLAATWNEELILQDARIISDEARAKHHEFARRDDYGIYKGLTFWSPNINIFRDPRWGRGQECYGEDPHLTGRIGVAFCRGLQGDDERYLKLVATPKHYAVHSGPEKDRHHFDAVVSPKDLRETYLPAFRDCIREAKAYSIMGAYNRTNGEPCCASKTLLQDILREEWGFDGYVVSDCGAICDIHAHHKVTSTPAESAALAVRNGCDLNCGEMYKSLTDAVEQGLVTEEEIDLALVRLFTARFRLGMFDPPENVPYASIPYELNDCEEHREMARETARQSFVLLKNQGNLLPLSPDVGTVAVIGPTADSLDVLLGNYFGTPSRYVTLLEGIRQGVSSNTRVLYSRGCELAGATPYAFSEALAAAERADVVIMCMGLSPRLEGEEGEVADSDGGGDRKHLHLPGVQQGLLEAVVATGKPVVLVLTNGSPLALPWAAENVPAILTVWYPGEEGGSALADVLFGKASPAGRLPVTFVKTLEELPPFEDYSMEGRTYRFMTNEPLWPFGFGLSYTTFAYSNLRFSGSQLQAGDTLTVTVDVENTGSRASDEVVQVYLQDLEASWRTPVRQLAGFRKITLQPGEKQSVSFTITARQMAVINDEGVPVLEPGQFRVTAAGSQGDARSTALGAAVPQTAEFEVLGTAMEMDY